MSVEKSLAIKAEAVRLFAEHGYPSTSMRDIARAVGLLPGSLYAHIASKERLLLEIVETGIDDFLSAMTPVVAAPVPAREKLRAAIKTHMVLIAQGLDRTGVVFHQWRFLTGADRERVLGKRRAYEEQFLSILDEGKRSGDFHPDLDARMAVLVILGVLNWAPEWFSPAGGGTPEDVGDRVSDLLISGVGVGTAAGAATDTVAP